MLVAIVVVGNRAVSGEAHVSHVPSYVDVEVLDRWVANLKTND